MHCINCSASIPEDLKFCPQCGTPIDGLEDVQEEKPAFDAPEVETVPDIELFEEEANAPVNTVNDDDLFDLGEGLPLKEEREEEEISLAEDAALDPTSPDFDPRKFAGLDQEAFRPMAASELLEEEEEEPEPEQPKEKKKGRGGIIALITVLVLVLVAGAAGLLYWLTMPVKELVLEDNFVQYMALDHEETITQFTIDRRETDRFKRADTVWCSVTVEDGSVHTERDYVMNYRLTTEGWKLVTVEELATESWITKPMTGADAETVSALLTGRQIHFGDDFEYALTAQDAANIEILSQTTDLEAGTDVVTAKVSGVDDLVGWTTEVEMTLNFDQQWQLASVDHTEPEVEFKPGMEFDLEEEDYLDVLAANPMPMFEDTDDVKTTVVSDGEEAAALLTAAQTVKLSKDQISGLTVVQTAFDMEADTQTVAVKFLLDKQVAKISVEAALTYVFDDGWKIDAITYAPTVEEVILDGEWTGTYTESEGRTPSVTLTIAENEDGTDNNVFAFGPSEANPYFFTGKYYVTDEVDKETLAVSLKATDWVLYYNPGGVAMVGLEGGFLMIDEAKITDGKTFTITLQRTVIETEAEQAPAEELIARTVEVTDVLILPEQSVQPGVSEEPELEPEAETRPVVEIEPAPAPETEPVTPPAEEQTETAAPETEDEPFIFEEQPWYDDLPGPDEYETELG